MAVAVIRDRQGRVLLARRPPHVHQGGLWEYPGGKVEAGETVEQALSRELWEELHIRPLMARPLIKVPFHYPEQSVYLDVWRVDQFSGDAVGREGQPLAWVAPRQLRDYPAPAASGPITAAAMLPEQYVITAAQAMDVSAFMARLERCLGLGLRLFQLRVLDVRGERYEALVRATIERAHAYGAQVLVNDAPERALALGADGVHLSSRRLMSLRRRPLPAALWVGASCHTDKELAQALAIGADFAVLSPVAPTPSHPQARPLGWSRFAELVADLPLPVYALGGVGGADLDQALRCRAQGVAGIRGLWGGE